MVLLGSFKLEVTAMSLTSLEDSFGWCMMDSYSKQAEPRVKRMPPMKMGQLTMNLQA